MRDPNGAQIGRIKLNAYLFAAFPNCGVCDCLTRFKVSGGEAIVTIFKARILAL